MFNLVKDVSANLLYSNLFFCSDLTKNLKFDPNLHQAMSEVEDENKDTGSILEEIQPGYMLGERLLRPSLVSVAKKKTHKTDENNQKKEGK